MNTRSRSLAVLAFALAAALHAAPAEAQDARPVTVTGRVVDRNTGQPVAAARVEFWDRRLSAYSDTAGRFTIAGVPPGTHAVRVTRIGYFAADERWDVGATGGPFAVSLLPDALMLQELTVQVDAFERRRNAVGVSARVIPRERIVSSPAPNALELLRDRGINTTSCGRGSARCVRARGHTVRPSVYVDEAPAFGGLEQLLEYRPQDLYMVEVYGGGTHIRVYTTWFMDSAARRKTRPQPLPF
jgi:carboxypeptidase family protein